MGVPLMMEVSTTNDNLVNPIVQRILELLHSNALVNARLDELVKLRQSFCATLTEDLDLAQTLSENSESESENSAETLSEDSAAEILYPYSMRERLEKIISKLNDYYSRQTEKLKRPIKLNEEQENSFDLVNSLEKKIDETEKKYEESSRISEERMNQIIQTESRMIELKTNMQRLEEKLSDMENENQIIRSQALSVSSSLKKSPLAAESRMVELKTNMQRLEEKLSDMEAVNQYILSQALSASTSMRKSPLGPVPPLENGHHQAPAKTLSVRRSHVERNPESVEALFKCVTKDLGFSEGKPVAAFTLYNCLLHWKVFKLDKTSIFDHYIMLIGNAIEELVNSLEKKTKLELPDNVTDNELINKLTEENEKLKEQVNSLERKTKQEFPASFTENELINKLTEENEKLKEQVNSLERKTKQEFPASFTENEVINKLQEEKEHFEDLVNSLERKIDETEKKYEESSRISEERMNQIIDTESRMIELKTNIQRLEEKLSDMEAEKQYIRSQELSTSSSMKKSQLGSVPPLENGHHPAPAKILSVRRSHVERNPESVEALFKCVTKDLGFSEGKPVAAFTLYNCLLHWKVFELDKTSIFDHYIMLIGNAIEDRDNISNMAYWLSNTSALFFHLQRCQRAPARKPPTPTGFFGRVAQSFRSSGSLSSSAFNVVQQVEAKYPAFLFKQQLADFVEKIYGILRENMKNDLTPLLSSCIKEHRTGNDNSERTGSWLNIIECLNRFLKILRENYVPPILIQRVFNQTFQYINAEIFNSLILQKECCTFDNGEYVKSGLAELELWCTEVTEEYIGSSLDELNYSKQAVRFLVAQKKDELSYDDLTNDICPVLSSQQLYRVCTLYSDENDNTKSVSSDVTSRLKLLMTDDAGDDEKSLMLEDNSSIPINVEEISYKDKTVPKVKPPAELLENVAFQFLHDYAP